MRLLWLADVARAAGLQVVEVDGWRSRGSDTFSPLGQIIHATAGNRRARDQDELRVILNGSNTAPPPIAQLMLGRTGIVYVVASGRCNHALTGQMGYHKGRGNSYLLGIEGCNDNGLQRPPEEWSPQQYDAYVRLAAANNKHMGWSIASTVGHKEHQREKSDPTFNIGTFRNDVAARMGAGPVTPGSTDMGWVVELRKPSGSSWVWTNGIEHKPILMWHQKLFLERISGRPQEVVTSDLDFELMCGPVNFDENRLEHVAGTVAELQADMRALAAKHDDADAADESRAAEAGKE